MPDDTQNTQNTMHLVLQTDETNWKEILVKFCQKDNTTEGFFLKEVFAGLDVPCPKTIHIPPSVRGHKIHLGVKIQPTSHFWLVPRSSIAKTPLRMSNTVGVIDKDYRGELIFCVDNLSAKVIKVKQGQRLCQIVAPNMGKISFSFGKTNDTKRGTGGFGSTGPGSIIPEKVSVI